MVQPRHDLIVITPTVSCTQVRVVQPGQARFGWMSFFDDNAGFGESPFTAMTPTPLCSRAAIGDTITVTVTIPDYASEDAEHSSGRVSIARFALNGRWLRSWPTDATPDSDLAFVDSLDEAAGVTFNIPPGSPGAIPFLMLAPQGMVCRYLHGDPVLARPALPPRFTPLLRQYQV